MAKLKFKLKKIYFKLKACFIILFLNRTYAFASCRKSKAKGKIWVDVYNSGGFIQSEINKFEDLMHIAFARMHHIKNQDEVLEHFKNILECAQSRKESVNA